MSHSPGFILVRTNTIIIIIIIIIVIVIIVIIIIIKCHFAQSAGAVENTDCFSPEG